MKQFVCIVCPNGCGLMVDENTMEVTGHKCKRGIDFGVNEVTNPMRTICTTVKTTFAEAPVLPVRVSEDIPKSQIFEVMSEINKVVLSKSVSRGDVIIANVLGLGVDVIATSDLIKEL